MNAAIILSGGSGLRLGSEIPKQYLEVSGKPILVRTMEQFQRCGRVDRFIVVADERWEAQILTWKTQFSLFKLAAIAPAGKDRQQSIKNGLLAAKSYQESGEDGVVIQDAVRPLTSEVLLNNLLDGLKEAPAVMPSLPVTDTVYISRDGKYVDGLLERSAVYAGQAPEAFRFAPYLRLYEETPCEELSALSGSCQLPYRAGWKVKLIPGERDNIKITYASDLELCEKLLRERKM